jgi:hypothetical protein
MSDLNDPDARIAGLGNGTAAEPEKIGYRRPPKATRFKPGQSGNPSGRPKGSKNLATVVVKTMRERVTIKENNKRRTVSKLEAAVAQIVNRAAIGEPRASRQFVELVTMIEARDEGRNPAAAPLNESDRRAIANIAQRLNRSAKND